MLFLILHTQKSFYQNNARTRPCFFASAPKVMQSYTTLCPGERPSTQKSYDPAVWRSLATLGSLTIRKLSRNEHWVRSCLSRCSKTTPTSSYDMFSLVGDSNKTTLRGRDVFLQSCAPYIYPGYRCGVSFFTHSDRFTKIGRNRNHKVFGLGSKMQHPKVSCFWANALAQMGNQKTLSTKI